MNGRHYVVPMSTEEPSVIAAASATSKLIAENAGGFQTSHTANIMITQIQITFAPNKHINMSEISTTSSDSTLSPYAAALSRAVAVAHKLEENAQSITQTANTFCPNMVKRGGGVIGIECHIRTPSPYSLSPLSAIQAVKGLNPQGDQPTSDKQTSLTEDDLPFLAVHLLVNVCDAMGANLVNTSMLLHIMNTLCIICFPSVHN